MRRALILLLLLSASLVLAALLGCEASSMDTASAGDTDGDGDTDDDTDSDSDVDIEYPEHINPHLDLTGAMTGPISPPPESFNGVDALDGERPDGDEQQDDWDAGVLEEGD